MSYARPSVFPAWNLCACFDSKEEVGEAAHRGTAQHKALEKILKGDPAANDLTMLEPGEAEGVIWAAEYIREWCAKLDAPIQSEIKMVCEDTENFDAKPLYDGTADAICNANLFDYKSGDPHDYEFQMYAYAWMMFQKNPTFQQVTCHLLYGKVRSAVRFHIRPAQAEAEIKRILAARANPAREPMPCEFCKWCDHLPVCGAIHKVAFSVCAGREDFALENYHASEIGKASEMSKALRMARFLSGWCEAVEHHAKNMAVKNGEVIPGFVVSKRAGHRFVKDMPMALGLSQLTPDEFLRCCTAKIGDLEKKLGKKQCAELLAPVLGRGTDSYFLTAEKEEKSSEEIQAPVAAAATDTEF